MQRKITKRGDAWAMVTLEDLEGAIDILLFPSAYQLASTLLTEDAIVTVKGRLSRSKDQPEMHGQEVSLPDLTDGPAGPVVISLPSTRCTPPVVEQLKDVLGTHPGVTEVRLRLMTKSSTTVMKLDDRLRVTPTSALFADLKALLGPSCLAGCEPPGPPGPAPALPVRPRPCDGMQAPPPTWPRSSAPCWGSASVVGVVCGGRWSTRRCSPRPGGG